MNEALKMNSRILSLTVAMVLALSTIAAEIETDRTWYLAGEAMTVSVTADDALIAYAELCDKHGLAAGVVVSLNAGEGTGVIELPMSCQPIRATMPRCLNGLSLSSTRFARVRTTISNGLELRIPTH